MTGSQHNVKATTIWACVSGGSCAGSFVLHAVPYLQLLALVISIATGLRAWIVSRK
jgi:hypothetical protein